MPTAIRHQLSFAYSGTLTHTPAQRQLRRYTPLQKTLTELLHQLKQQYPTAYEQLTKGDRCQVIYGSPLGELAINMSQTANILADSLPLSPVKFQRSVLNASYSQCAIEHDLTCAATALTRGFLTTDAAIALGDMLLRAGDCEGVLILVGEEYTRRALTPPQPSNASQPSAWGQALWLVGGDALQLEPTDCVLEQIRYHPAGSPASGDDFQGQGDRLGDRQGDRQEESTDSTLSRWQAAAHRHIINSRGECYVSAWHLDTSAGKEAG